MASISRSNTKNLQGMLGQEFVFRNWAGKTIVSKAPGSRTKKLSPGQLRTMENFQLASRYAKAVLQNTDLAEAYSRALKPRQNLHSRAMQDFVQHPVVSSIKTQGYSGQPGNLITIRATDDFRVTAVLVEIYAADGSLLEEGNAVVTTNGIDWTYAATGINNPLTGSCIKAIAIDVPGNEGSLDIQL